MTAIYEKERLREVRFPLGGLGAGNVSLAGNGALVDWEQAGVANKGTYNGFTHFAIKAERDGVLLDARALLSDAPGPRTGRLEDGCRNAGYGFGPNRYSCLGMPHFETARMQVDFPFAQLDLSGAPFPGAVQLTAFSPFIPLDAERSGLPAAFFTWQVENTSQERLTYTLAFSAANPFAVTGAVNRRQGNCLVLEGPAAWRQQTRWGALALSAPSERTEDLQVQTHWYRGNWFDGLSVFWRNFTTGALQERDYPADSTLGREREADMATLATAFTLEPGQRRSVRFVLAWYYPWAENDWSPMTQEELAACAARGGPASNQWRKYYATRFQDVLEVSEYAAAHWQDLEANSRAFASAMNALTLPPEARDAAVSNLAVLKTPTCLLLEDGSLYGWEGLNTHSGSCEGTCTHVWNYQYAVPYLFPKLERSLRELDFTYNMDEAGGMHFRLQLPLGRGLWDFLPCCDGQFGGVFKLYREFLLCGDLEWLRRWYPLAKRSLEYAWSPDNPCQWDRDRDGVLEGRQHHTLDMELFGPNSWLTGMYLCALQAAALMGERLGDPDAADYWDLFHRGKAYVERRLFNGRYYAQAIDLSDRSLLAAYEGGPVLVAGETAGSVTATYWNEEAQEIKYQVGEGCLLDQVLGQWHANLLGLPERVFDADHTVSALRSIYAYNYQASVRDHFNPCRLYCMDDEAGTTICQWPEGTYKPVIPAPYSEETMHGFEYQAAIHMIQEGLVQEGLELVRAVRDRYDGRTRNPYNEYECGNHYARSMAAFGLLPTFAGFACDLARGYLRFSPILSGDFTGFFSVEGAWGLLCRTAEGVRVEVIRGALELRTLEAPFLAGEDLVLEVGTKRQAVQADGHGCIDLAGAWRATPEQPLCVLRNPAPGGVGQLQDR